MHVKFLIVNKCFWTENKKKKKKKKEKKKKK